MEGGGYLANAKRLALKTYAQVMAPPPPVDLRKWAMENIEFTNESQFPGKYNSELFPEFDEILSALSPEHPAREVVMVKSAQVGGTVLAQIFVGGSLALDPSPFLYVFPTIENAARWSKQKWKAMVRNSPILTKLFTSGHGRDALNSLLFMETTDGRGWLQIGGANSEAGLSMVSAPRQVHDDLSKWENNNAGDPEGQADARSKAFLLTAKIFKISTPLIDGSCRISKAYRRSTQGEYHLPCPHCNYSQPLEWENLKANIRDDDSDSAFFTCVSCGGVIEHHHLAGMKERGRWVHRNPDSNVPGFYIWTAYSALADWKIIRENWLKAKGDPQSEQAFLNDWVGVAYKAAGESPPWHEIMVRSDEDGHRRGVVPVGGLLLTMGIDVQADRVECHICAYGAELRSWTVDYVVIEGEIRDKETWKKLDELLHREWLDSFGNRRKIQLAAIDAGAWTSDVHDWARRHPITKVMMIRGVPGDQRQPLEKVKRERNVRGKLLKYDGRFFNVGVSPMKISLYQNLRKTDPLGRGFVGFPQSMGEDFFQQLCSERRVPVQKRGYVEYQWHKDKDIRNEVLDTKIYADASAIRLGWRTKNRRAMAKALG